LERWNIRNKQKRRKEGKKHLKRGKEEEQAFQIGK
jgi:hypothetical protein